MYIQKGGGGGGEKKKAEYVMAVVPFFLGRTIINLEIFRFVMRGPTRPHT